MLASHDPIWRDAHSEFNSLKILKNFFMDFMISQPSLNLSS